jgi:hypothetical protein
VLWTRRTTPYRVRLGSHVEQFRGALHRTPVAPFRQQTVRRLVRAGHRWMVAPSGLDASLLLKRRHDGTVTATARTDWSGGRGQHRLPGDDGRPFPLPQDPERFGRGSGHHPGAHQAEGNVRLPAHRPGPGGRHIPLAPGRPSPRSRTAWSERSWSAGTVAAGREAESEAPDDAHDSGTSGCPSTGSPSQPPLPWPPTPGTMSCSPPQRGRDGPSHAPPRARPEVIAKDGIPLAQPYDADTILVASGERYSLLVHAGEPTCGPGTATSFATPRGRTACAAWSPP